MRRMDGGIPKLYEAFSGSFDIGAAVNPRTIVQAGDLIAKHFNSLTAENEMKFVSVHPSEDTYTFEAADKIVAFAKEHGKKMRGHTLVWHNQTTEWLFQEADGSPVSREKLFDRLKSHIDTVVKRYKEDIYAWDVVNEVITDEGSDPLRPSKWLAIVGPEFIAKAFEFAHEADPKAQLFYNDYNESNPLKRDKIYQMVKSLLEQGVPVHGIGLQAHWSLYSPGLDEIRAAIEKYASLGLRLQLTELDISMFRHDDLRTDLASPTGEMLELQEQRYEAVFHLLEEYRNHIDAVTFWGAADDYTWLSDFPVRGRKNWPLLFNESHEPKGSFWRVVKQASQSKGS
ncbi:endo-1,4-beta-xylanase [Bacillus sp. FJAT-26390]|uniref:endo-1,4-beta-xylanase n=1 Tax=Bacillus sp. FJAT-26390 TaxID=1743142 RepID=UPI000807D809|nr:endo-1,4-beta-xylanase [Bacillus sp. FJAT-26390]OBZ12217.1 1,4-beta-xylanase [Bacillus sp. FJAT-26390]